MLSIFEGCESLKNVYTKDKNIKNEFNRFRKTYINESSNNRKYNFDVIDYEDDDKDIIDHYTIKQTTIIKVRDFDELKKAVKYKVSIFNQLNTDILDLTDIDVSDVTTFFGNESGIYSDEELFYNLDISKARYIDITGWDTSNAYSFMCLFAGCSNIEKIYGIEDLDVTNIWNLSHMFENCTKLESLDFSKWKPKYSIQYIWHMFDGCESLKSIKGLNNFKLYRMSCPSTECTFRNCYKLDNLDISSWDFDCIDNITCMFENCYSLKNLKISLSNKELRDGYAFSHSVNRK